MKYIQLTQGKISLVDDEDFDLNKHKWRTKLEPRNRNSYGIREVRDKNHKRCSEHLHRVILERKIGHKLKKGEVTDHIDSNGLNNCRNNLRVCSQAENMWNIRKRSDNTSGYRGIHYNKTKKGFDAYLNKEGIRYRLGRFKNLYDAIEARRQAEIKYYGKIYSK